MRKVVIREEVQICFKELHLNFFQRESPKLQGLKQMYFLLCLIHKQIEIRICMSWSVLSLFPKNLPPGSGLLTWTAHGDAGMVSGRAVKYRDLLSTATLSLTQPSQQAPVGMVRKAELQQTDRVQEGRKIWWNNWYLWFLRFHQNQVVCDKTTTTELEAVRFIAQVKISPLNWILTPLSS